MSTSRRRKSFDIETSKLIGSRIRAARADLSQENFAELIGVSRSALTNYEAGRRLPNDLILTKIAEATGNKVHDLLFEQPVVPFSTYLKKVEDAALEAAAKRPGFIPKFMVSDDEYAFISLFRLMQQEAVGRSILRQVVEYWQDTIAAAKSSEYAPPIEWGEGHLARLEAALERGELEEGVDPQQEYWVTFWEEAHARKDKQGPQ